MQLQRLLYLLRYILQILAVLLRHYYSRHACPDRRQKLFPEAAYRQHAATKGYFSGHGYAALYWYSRQRAGYGYSHGDACAGAVLWYSAFGHVQVYILLPDCGFVNAQPFGVGMHEGQCCLCAFLHHIAQLARKHQLAAARHRLHLYLQRIAAGAGPCKAVDKTDFVFMRPCVVIVPWPAEILVYARLGETHLLGLAVAYVACGLSAYTAHHPFKAAHTGLGCVAAYYVWIQRVGYCQHALFKAVLLHLLWQKMALGYLYFFRFKVAGYLYDLHSVQQRRGYGASVVGGGEEHHLGKIVRHLDEVIPEGEILRAVQHLKHGGRRVAMVIPRQLVYLIEKYHRVHHPGLTHSGYHPARHRTYIGAPMAPYFSLVPYAAQAHSDEPPS